MKLSLWTLSATWALPIFAAALVRRLGRPSRARQLAIFLAVLSTLLAVFVFVAAHLEHAFVRVDAPLVPALGPLRYHLAVDGLGAVLLPLTAALSLGALWALPRAQVHGASAADLLLISGCTQGVIVSMDLGLLTIFFCLSLVPFWSAVRALPGVPLRRLFLTVAWGCAVPLLGATAAIAVFGIEAGMPAPLDLPALGQLQHSQALPPLLGALILLAALLRMGLFPLHAWLPAAMECGSTPGVFATLAAPLGSFLTARVVLPLFPELCARAAWVLLPLAVCSAVYGALLSSAQHDVRRMLGFFRISQAGFVVAGVVTMSAASVSGALLHAMVTIMATSGLLLLASALHARTGTTDLRRLGGLVRQLPQMATGCLLLSAAAVGFPATMGFVSEDLIVQGLLRAHPIAAALLLIVTAFNGITLFRAFKRSFLGAGAPHAVAYRDLEDLYPRERNVLVAIVLTLLIGGFVPVPFIALHQGVVEVLQKFAAASQPMIH